MPARYAIYYAPAPATRLWRIASAWLGWDPATGIALPPLSLGRLPRDEMLAITEAPRRYGFHATLKAPFELARGASEQSLVQVMSVFAAHMEPFDLPVVFGQLKDFLALIPAKSSPQMDRLASACVQAFEPFRAPLTEFDRARRRKEAVTPRQQEMLDRWGYPHVHDEFRFHLSLTGSLDVITLGRARKALTRLLGEELSAPLRIDAICLFKQHERGERFQVLDRFPLGLGTRSPQAAVATSADR